MRLLHGHIFKNGGTTFEGILSNTFGSGHLIVEDEMRMHREKGKYLKELIEERPFKALSTHFLPVQEALKDQENFVIVFLRDPIERALSVYEFEKKQQHNSRGAINAKKMSPKEYFEWRLSADSPPVIRDYQTRYLLQNDTVSEYDLDSVLNILKKNDRLFVGAIKDMRSTLEELVIRLSKYDIFLDVEYDNRNVNKNFLSWSTEQKHNYLLDMVGFKIFENILNSNRGDLDLYEWIV